MSGVATVQDFSAPSPSTRILLAATATAIAAVLAPTLLVLQWQAVPRPVRVPTTKARVVPKAELPTVEPLRLAAVTPDEARAYNAAIPFSDGPNPAARPFVVSGSPEEQARATDCMAAAMLYEAGDDPLGQQSVGQVVINRVRHPAFPKTICGVVFQGQERRTGCQFTFTCDGAMLRHRWSDAAWKRARALAAEALNGKVFRAVGHATHYHTDWVVPYWQSSLDKVAKVRTHIFFRWTGWWGTPAAFGRRYNPAEPAIAALGPYSAAHLSGVGAAASTVPDPSLPAAMAAAGGLVPHPSDSNSFVLLLDRRQAPDSYAMVATAACGERAYCKVMAWTDRAKLPATLPLQQAQVATMAFSYLRDRARGLDKALWNCGEFPRADPRQCMKLQIFAPVPRSVQAQTDSFRLENTAGARVVLPASTGMAAPLGDASALLKLRPSPKPTPAPAPSPTPAAPR